ncbi:SUMF1/EgtB/PvdO family nonheme iron enzyme, partial [Chromobacterium alticapitis]
HAARAYCASEGARLPTWYEWEKAAAADDKRPDARDDPAWRERILRWYEQPGGRRLPAVGQNVNFWRVSDMHGSIYEWVEDFNGLFVATDSRAQGEQRTLATCGAAALSLGDRDNYTILMRIAMLVALNGNDAPQAMGFRCAKDAAKDTDVERKP